MPEKAVTVALVGRSGAGKTYLLTRVVARLKEHGLRVATLKHTHHHLDPDRPGSDTHQHRAAGADRATLIGPGVCVTWFEGEADPLTTASAARGDCDILLVEGYKRGPFRRIEVVGQDSPVLEEGEAWLTVRSDQVDLVTEKLLQLTVSE